MSTGPATEEPESEYGDEPSPVRRRDRRADGTRVVLAAGALALLAVAGTTAVRVLYNLPVDPVPVSPALRSGAAAATLSVVAGALAALALSTDRAAVRVGLLFAAVFGTLPSVARAATLPGVVGVVAGGGLALSATVDRPTSYRTVRRAAIALGVVASIGVSLAAATGVVGAELRGVGGLLAVGALVGIGARVGADPVGLAVGGVAFLATAVGAAVNPFVAGSALLTAFAVVGVPHLFVAVAVGCCVGVAVASVRRADYATALGACILLSAGLPATLPRALAVLLGATLVLLPAETLAGSAPGLGVAA